MFDGFLQARAERLTAEFVPFDSAADYTRYVDGKPRNDGVRSFLESRGIALPDGPSADSPRVETIAELGNRKNELVLELLRRKGVEPFEGSVLYVRAVLASGLHCAVVSSSANCRQVLLAAGIADLFEVRIDPLVAQQQHLKGKPAPDTFLAASGALRSSAPASGRLRRRAGRRLCRESRRVRARGRSGSDRPGRRTARAWSRRRGARSRRPARGAMIGQADCAMPRAAATGGELRTKWRSWTPSSDMPDPEPGATSSTNEGLFQRSYCSVSM